MEFHGAKLHICYCSRLVAATPGLGLREAGAAGPRRGARLRAVREARPAGRQRRRGARRVLGLLAAAVHRSALGNVDARGAAHAGGAADTLAGSRDPVSKRPARRLGAAAGAVSSPPGRAGGRAGGGGGGGERGSGVRKRGCPFYRGAGAAAAAAGRGCWGGRRAAAAPPNMPFLRREPPAALTSPGSPRPLPGNFGGGDLRSPRRESPPRPLEAPLRPSPPRPDTLTAPTAGPSPRKKNRSSPERR